MVVVLEKEDYYFILFVEKNNKYINSEVEYKNKSTSNGVILSNN